MSSWLWKVLGLLGGASPASLGPPSALLCQGCARGSGAEGLGILLRVTLRGRRKGRIVLGVQPGGSRGSGSWQGMGEQQFLTGKSLQLAEVGLLLSPSPPALGSAGSGDIPGDIPSSAQHHCWCQLLLPVCCSCEGHQPWSGWIEGALLLSCPCCPLPPRAASAGLSWPLLCCEGDVAPSEAEQDALPGGPHCWSPWGICTPF